MVLICESNETINVDIEPLPCKDRISCVRWNLFSDIRKSRGTIRRYILGFQQYHSRPTVVRCQMH